MDLTFLTKRTTISMALLVFGLFPALSYADQINVNFIGSFGSTPKGWKDVVSLNPGDKAGAGPWASDKWQNVLCRPSKNQISSREGKSVSLHIVSMRNPFSISHRKLRAPETHDNGNAKLWDCHINATEDPGDGRHIGVFEVSEIPYEAYDLVVYLGIHPGHGYDGKGWIKVNDSIEKNFVVEKNTFDWKYKEITNPVDKGNYIVIRGLTGPKLKMEVSGKNFNHLGPAGLQIVKAKEARMPLKITSIKRDVAKNCFSVTWNSVPGDAYAFSYSKDNKNFFPFGKPVIPADKKQFSTTLDSVPCPVAPNDKLFLRIVSPDYQDPVWEKVSGVGDAVVLTFSEPVLKRSIETLGNFSVRDGDSRALSIQSVSMGKTRNRVRIKLTRPLAPNSQFEVAFKGVTDLAGRPVSNLKPMQFKTWDNQSKGVKVFILAGQSNMVGFGESEKGQGGAKGGKGSLRHLVNTNPDKYGDLVDQEGRWASRKDVRFWWNRGRRQNEKGDLTIGYGSSKERIGPEYAFGQVAGDHFDEPVLIIKTAWGGKSLFRDFRPPSAVSKRGGSVGFYYNEMLKNVHEVLDNFEDEFPEWKGKGYEIVGFAWHQGYNDSLNNFPAEEYKENIVDFIADIRDEFGKPKLPFSLATTGHGGKDQKGARLILTNSQLSILDRDRLPHLAGNVAATDTRPFQRSREVSPTNAGHHWYHNAETYYEIGESLGTTMLEMIQTSGTKSR